MFSNFIIALRETLEAALVVGIIVSCLKKSGFTHYHWTLYSALCAGIGGSLIGALLLSRLSVYFRGGVLKEIFEAGIMIIGAALLIATIFWLHKYKTTPDHIKKQVVGYCVFLTSLKIPIKHFFTVTNALLILFAVSLITRGIYEIMEL